VLCPEFGDRLGRRHDAPPAPASARAHPTHLLVLLDLARDPLPLAFSRTFSGPCAGQQPAEAALDNSVVQFALALAQRRVEHVFLLGRERALNVHFETAKKEGAKDLVQLVDENGVARLGEAVGECRDLESGVGHDE